MLLHEDITTFDSFIDFVTDEYPILKDRKTISLVDGDQANFNSIERKLRKSTIVTCLYHISGNVKQYIMPWLKKKVITINDDIEDEQVENELYESVENVQSPYSTDNIVVSSSSSASSSTATTTNVLVDVNVDTCIADFKILVTNARNESNSVKGNGWFNIFDSLRKSPTNKVADMKLDYLFSSGLSYAKYLKKIKHTWLLCNYTWEITLGCQSTQLQEGVFA